MLSEAFQYIPKSHLLKLFCTPGVCTGLAVTLIEYPVKMSRQLSNCPVIVQICTDIDLAHEKAV